MKILRVRCPLCGHMPAEHELKEELDEIKVYEQELGGKRKLTDEVIEERMRRVGLPTKWTRISGYPGCAPGVINYRDISEERREELEKWRRFFVQKARKLH